MSLLAAAFFFLTYTDPTADRDEMRPSVLLRLFGGWADIEDFDDGHLLPKRKDVPDAQNGIVELREANALIPEEEREEELDRFRAMRSGEEDWDDEYVAEVLERRADVLAKLDALVAKPRLQFPMVDNLDDSTRLVFDAMVLLDYLRMSIRYSERHDKWREAVAAARTMRELAKRVVECEGAMIHFLVGVSFELTACREIESLPKSPRFPAPLLPELVAIAGKDVDYESAMEYMWRNEYLGFTNFVRDLQGGLSVQALGMWGDATLPNNWDTFWSACFEQILITAGLQPNRTRKNAAACFAHMLKLSAQPRLKRREMEPPRRVRRFFPDDGGMIEPWMFTSSNGFGDAMLKMYLPPMTRILDNRLDQVLAYERALRVLCALRIFSHREGRLPGSLEELVPRDLAAVPVDPFSGKAFGYSAEKRRLWSVGEDGKDAGGNPEAEDFMDRNSRDEPTINFGWLE